MRNLITILSIIACLAFMASLWIVNSMVQDYMDCLGDPAKVTCYYPIVKEPIQKDGLAR